MGIEICYLAILYHINGALNTRHSNNVTRLYSLARNLLKLRSHLNFYFVVYTWLVVSSLLLLEENQPS